MEAELAILLPAAVAFARTAFRVSLPGEGARRSPRPAPTPRPAKKPAICGPREVFPRSASLAPSIRCTASLYLLPALSANDSARSFIDWPILARTLGSVSNTPSHAATRVQFLIFSRVSWLLMGVPFLQLSY